MPQSNWDYWQQNLVPSAGNVDPAILSGMGFDEASDAIVNRLLNDTNAELYLSPWMIRRYKNMSALPFLTSDVMNMSQGKTPSDSMNSSTLKDWIMSAKNGMGNYNPASFKTLVQGALGHATHRGTDPNNPDYQISAYLQQNPEVMAALLSLGIGNSPYGQFQKQQLQSKMDALPAYGDWEYKDSGGANWLDWLMNVWGGGYTSPWAGTGAEASASQQKFRGSAY